MGENFKMIVDMSQLEKGLLRLGIRELEERLEVSPLVFGGQDVNNFQPDQGLFHCGSYKEEDLYDFMDQDTQPPGWVR